jgi:hypothetical protein
MTPMPFSHRAAPQQPAWPAPVGDGEVVIGERSSQAAGRVCPLPGSAPRRNCRDNRMGIGAPIAVRQTLSIKAAGW